MMNFIERWRFMLKLQKISIDLKIFVFNNSYYEMMLVAFSKKYMASYIYIVNILIC